MFRKLLLNPVTQNLSNDTSLECFEFNSATPFQLLNGLGGVEGARLLAASREDGARRTHRATRRQDAENHLSSRRGRRRRRASGVDEVRARRGERRHARQPAAAAIRAVAQLASSGEPLLVPRDSRRGVVRGGASGVTGEVPLAE